MIAKEVTMNESRRPELGISHVTIEDNARAHLGNNYTYNNLPQERPETPPEPSSNVPFRRDRNFVERGDLLDEISDKLAQPAARVALVGLGGIGYDIRRTQRVRQN